MGIFHNIGIQYSLDDLQITVWGFVEFLQLQAQINFFYYKTTHTSNCYCYKLLQKVSYRYITQFTCALHAWYSAKPRFEYTSPNVPDPTSGNSRSPCLPCIHFSIVFLGGGGKGWGLWEWLRSVIFAFSLI